MMDFTRFIDIAPAVARQLNRKHSWYSPLAPPPPFQACQRARTQRHR